MVVVLWQNWGEHVGRQLPHFLAGATLTDVTISVGAASLKAHRIILAFFSPFFRKMLEDVSEERPMVVVFPGVNFEALQCIVTYMYHGQVNVPTDLLPSVIDLVKMLKVKGLIELPAHLDSVIGASSIRLDQSTLTNTHTEDMSLEGGEGMVELEVSEGDQITPHHTTTPTLPTTTITTTTQPDAHTMDTEDVADIQVKMDSSSSIDDGIVRIDVGEDDDPHSLLLPPHLSPVSPQLTPTHIVKLSEDGTMGEMLLGDYLTPTTSTTPSPTTTTAATTTSATITAATTITTTLTESLQDGGEEFVPARKKRKAMHKLAKYGPEDLQRALGELRAGLGTLREVGERWGVPHSTLAMAARQLGVSLPGRQNRYDMDTLEAAKQAVRGGASYLKVSRDYNIPKSVLWRHCQQEEAQQEEAQIPTEDEGREGEVQGDVSSSLTAHHHLLQPLNRRTLSYTTCDVNHAREMLLLGSTLSVVAKETKVPKTTIFRMKEQLVEEGLLPPSSITRVTHTCRSSELSLQQAVAACMEGGMSQGRASEKFQVSKTTIWRRLKQLQGNTTQTPGDTNTLQHSNSPGNPKTTSPAGIKLEDLEDQDEEQEVYGSVELSYVSKSPHDPSSPSDKVEGEVTGVGVGVEVVRVEEQEEEEETQPRFELEMPLVNLPGGGYQVVGSEIVIGGGQVVVLEAPPPSPTPSTTATTPPPHHHHHHLVMAAFDEMEGLEIEQTENISEATKHLHEHTHIQ